MSWKLCLLPADDCKYSNTAEYGALGHGFEGEDAATWGGASESNRERFNLKNIWRQKQILKIVYTTVLSLISKSL